MPEMFTTFALYNRWANARLHKDLANLQDEKLHTPLEVNFGSIIGILNHLLLADTLWLDRFSGQGQMVLDIAAIPYPVMPSFLAARQALDEKILSFAASLAGQNIDITLEYKDIAGRSCAADFATLVHHFFNHQTHHRGQVHALASMFGAPLRDIDLVYFLKEQTMV